MHRDVEDRLVIESIGFDSLDCGLRMVDFKDEAPEPKYYTVDIPGGDSVIDLTESLNGDVVYNRGKQTFQFAYLGGGEESDEDSWSDSEFELFKTDVKNRLHGRRHEYSLSFDPGYTYTGRFAVSFDDNPFAETHGIVTVSVEREPYKFKGVETVAGNMSAGVLLRVTSGRKRVQPTIELTAEAVLVAGGKRYRMPAGSYAFNDIWFSQGINELFAMSAGTKSRITHKELSRFTYGEIRSRRRIFEWMNGLERYVVSRIELEGSETPVSGVVTFAATCEDGSVIERSLDLGDEFVGKLTDYAYTYEDEDGTAYETQTFSVADRLVIENGVAVLYKYVMQGEGGYWTDGTCNTVVFDFPDIFSNDSPIASLSCDAGPATYWLDGQNVERVFIFPTHGDYAEGGQYQKTHAQMAAHRHADLGRIDTETSEVYDEGNDFVYVQYEWSDL